MWLTPEHLVPYVPPTCFLVGLLELYVLPRLREERQCDYCGRCSDICSALLLFTLAQRMLCFHSSGGGNPRQGRLEGCQGMSAATHLICGLEGV